MAIADAHISATLAAYLERFPEEAAGLAEPALLLRQGRDFASRWTFPMHVTVGALLVRGEAEILLVEHRAYGLLLQPGGHLEPADTTLIGAAVRELAEETGVDTDAVLPVSYSPAYIEYGRVPARPDKGEPEHHHLDIGFAFTTVRAEIGRVQEAEVTGAGWYSLPMAERLVGPRVARAVGTPGRSG
ncbi:NUDIX hydrolase [Marinactinospora thermotolerans]|uniref:8-oxo-dGTP pyrophosphatase MutT, NUDIX family n=1 Tax=Marinactinospora thermotolerans DSM 45154 TaxID=1122192 RepID=A0A1T4SC91_9ACTN|nr:NUDIX domain-containing protein [Marinactinospora thermotolerans]SKA25528.1 8-oxo-dGTP pyrophosphatase MutT, NUDIX family [Marinactinospora thermotolerans DSM 45154]